MLDFKAVFDELRISWRDRGKNCSRGRVNISCPWCGDDPSEHLSIDEFEGRYYCWRCQEGGHSLTRLFTRLGVEYFAVPALLNRHNTEVIAVTKRQVKEQSSIAKMWSRFESAADSPVCINYLRLRGFPSPLSTCRQYDLRYAKGGRWAQRLLVPVKEGDEIVTWVGRATRTGVEPKYFLEPCDHPVIYVPRPPRETLILVEGSIDALKVAVATNDYKISSAALLGKGFAPEKITQVISLAVNCKRILVAMDADVSIVTTLTIVHELAATVNCPVDMLPIPRDVKDPGAMAMGDIIEWTRMWQ